MKTCRICGDNAEHSTFQVREMQHCMKDWFEYFQCKNCKCIQIGTIPANISKYYPSDYYSFSETYGNDLLKKRASFFRSKQATHLIGKKDSWLGRIFSIGYKPSSVFEWLKISSTDKHEAILDIGTGTGWLLKKLWHYGYQNLTGVDPFIRRTYDFPGKLKILKLDPLELEESQPYKFIMMHHSLEHMSDQDAIMKKTNQLLASDGKVLIRIPIYSRTLLDRYGTDLVSLDAPRHLFVHSVESLEIVAKRNGFKVDQVIYDADSSSFWASEQYTKDICLNAPNSYGISRKNSIFKKRDIAEFKKAIRQLNKKGESDTAAFYLVKA